MRRLFLLCFLLLFVLTGFAAAESDDFEYIVSEDNSSVTISAYTGSAKKVVVPSEISGIPVTAIGEAAFQNQTQISKITLPKSIARIEDKAFFGCSALTTINLHKSVKFIADNAFKGCDSLLPKVYPDSYAHRYFSNLDLPYQYFQKTETNNFLTVDPESANLELDPFTVSEDTAPISPGE